MFKEIKMFHCRQEVSRKQSNITWQWLPGGRGQDEAGDSPANVANSLEHHHVWRLQEPVVHVKTFAGTYSIKWRLLSGKLSVTLMFEKVFYPKHFTSEFARPSDILSTKWQERFYDDLVWEPDGGDREELVDQEQGQVHPELVRL